MKKPILIATADWHLRDSTPPCRTDDFEQAQWNKVQLIKDLQLKYDCPVIHAGDLFHHWKPSPYLLSKTLENLPNKFYTIYGNHDLPQHNLELRRKSGIFTLERAGALKVLDNTHWEQEVKESSLFPYELNIKMAVWHVMTYQGKSPFPGVKNPARSLIRRHNFDLMITGHNHQSFVEEHEGRLLINPGSITRQESDEADRAPCVFLVFADLSYEPIFLPIEKNVVIVPETTEVQKERDERIQAFIEKLESTGEGMEGVDYEKNLEIYQQRNKIENNVKQIINRSLDYENK